MNNSDLFRDIIVVYCPPKVGSTTLVTSLRLCCSDKFMIFHTHKETIFEFIDKDKNNLTISDILKNNNIIGDNLIKTNRKIYFIDIYRSPIERKISEFFEDISLYHFNNSEENIVNYDIKKVIKRFNDIFLHIGNEDYYTSRYKLKKPKSFDFQKKYIKESNSDITYIKLRLIDAKNWGSILTDLLQTTVIIVLDHETKDKKINLLYENFNKVYKLPENYYNEISKCSLLKYYYTSNEIKDYLSKWKIKIEENYKGLTYKEFNIYEMITQENKFYNRVLFNHYKDEGCLCVQCKDSRKLLFESIKEGNINIDNIIHDKSKEYERNIYVNIYSIDKIEGYIINL